MNYPENIEKKLDFDVLRERLGRYCSSSLGREQVDAMSFLTDYDTICHLLQETQEMVHVREDASLSFPRGNITDLRENLARIRIEGLFLDEEELHQLRQTIGYAIDLEQFFSHLDSTRFPILSTLTIASTTDLLPIRTRIDKVLDPFGQLRDNASPELARIRKELNAAQGSVNRAINSILRQAQAEGLLDKDAAPTLREGRLVLPIPPGLKKKIGGIVHDESATGKTVFIEPASVVEANNRIRSLEGEQKRERARILTELTNQIRPTIPTILQTETYLAHIDFLGAKAELGRALHAIAPEVQDYPTLQVRGGRHPVLYLRFIEEGREVVPLNLRLGESGHRILVISGPNAGGKSVCLKTIGLIQYMLQCGLLVPVEEDSVLGVFQQILLDIGDEQSIADDLSTYSSHLRNMKYFAQHANPDTLFLIDEFGSGTEPAIGGALAEALLTDFNRQQAIGIVTTHYTNLKHLAEQTEGLINGAMLYDRGALKPLFQLSVGQAGSSFAIEIARQTGLPENIVQQAIELVGAEHIDYDKQLQDIARDKRYWENKRQNIRQKEKHLEEKIAFYEQEIAGLKAKKREIIAEAKEEAQNLLQQSNATIERTIREIKESKADKERTRKARGRVESLKLKVESLEKPNSTPAAKLKEKKKKEVLRDFKDLKGMSASLPSSQPSVINTIRRAKMTFQRELDMRGLRIDEAEEQLIAYMDSAIMVNAGEVSILHGTGTGALKQLTMTYLQRLKKQNRIRDFHEGDVNHGGAGFTIVEI